MNMEKRALLAIVISMAILLLSQPLIVKYSPKQKQQQKASVTVSPVQAPATAPQIQKTEQPAQPIQPARQADGKDIIFENDNYHAVLSNAGGVIKSLTLKKHLDANARPMVLFDESNPSDATFSLFGLDPAIDKALFSYSMRPNGVFFTAKSADGLSIEKEITFRPGSYAIDLRQTLTNYSGQSRNLKYSIVNGVGLTSLSQQD
jgi:YidC/Oxa1 family membrane protein insertase